ncbi:MAG: hypothetical protein ABSA79_05390 [Candidatus Bathyarchaeia archaeon]
MVVGRDAIETYDNEVRHSFPCCPLCGSKHLEPNLVPGGRDSLLCEDCKAQWHLTIGLIGLKWTELDNASENGEGKALLGKRFEKGQWKKMAEKRMNTSTIVPNSREINQIAREKEIIREKEVIIKIRCSYCKQVYDEVLDKCPQCGGRR